MRYLALLLLLVPLHAAALDANTLSDVKDATYRLYIRVSPPGRQVIQTIGFCSASFYRADHDADIPEGIYGTTAGHCLDFYQVARDRLTDRMMGLKFQLAVAPDNQPTAFIPVEGVDHGFKRWRRWLDQDAEDKRDWRPEPEQIDDWAIIRAPVDADLNMLPLADKKTVTDGDTLHVSGFPYSLGWTVTAGKATAVYSLPGSIVDGYIAAGADVAPGSSGSPAVNDEGELVGITVAKIPQGPALITPRREIGFPHETGFGASYSSEYSYEGYQGLAYDQLMPRTEMPLDTDALMAKIQRAINP